MPGAAAGGGETLSESQLQRFHHKLRDRSSSVELPLTAAHCLGNKSGLNALATRKQVGLAFAHNFVLQKNKLQKQNT